MRSFSCSSRLTSGRPGSATQDASRSPEKPGPWRWPAARAFTACTRSRNAMIPWPTYTSPAWQLERTRYSPVSAADPRARAIGAHGLHAQPIQPASGGRIGARQPVDRHAGGTGRGRRVRAAAVAPASCRQPGIVPAGDPVTGGHAAEAGRRGPPGAEAVQGDGRRLERFAFCSRAGGLDYRDLEITPVPMTQRPQRRRRGVRIAVGHLSAVDATELPQPTLQ
jgi:hypothetical protein